ncbi:MAG: hypothetical protein CMJ34_05850 [Phycisphaerae bacterium]|nr:hypothetical protein [Phycisphaerae bacterium]
MGPDRDHFAATDCRWIRRVVSALSVIFAASVLLFMSPGSHAGQDETVALPGMEAVEALGTLVGEWSMSGLAGSDAENDNAGRMFQARQSVEWIEPGRSLGVVWSVMLTDGSIITSGRGRINWDDIAGAVVNTYRGEEDGRPFTGSATLIAAGDGVFDWRGHETSGTSESVNFEVTYAFPTDDLCMVDFIPTCVDGDVELDAARFSWKRVNPLHEAMPFAPDLVGEWILRSGGSESIPDGSRLMIRSGRGDRSLSFVILDPGAEGDFIASEVLWLDDDTGDMGFRMITSAGEVREGSPSVARRDGRVGLLIVWGPEDDVDGRVGGPEDLDEAPFRASWMTLDGDRMDLEFMLMDADGRSGPDESRSSMIWMRSKD